MKLKKYPGLGAASRWAMVLILISGVFSLVFLTRPARGQQGSGNPPPSTENCTDSPSTNLSCIANATIVDKVTISPYAGSNAPYGSIVCAGGTVTITLSQSTLPSTNTSQVCHTCPSNYCDPTVTNAGPSPYNITNLYYYETPTNPGYVQGYGNSATITMTNGFSGWGYIWNDSAQMPTNPPACGYGVTDNTTESTTYAFVAVGGMSVSGGEYVTNSAGNAAYLVAYCTNGAVTVTASPNPGMDDQYLPACWNVTGGVAATNSDGSTSRTKRVISTATVGATTVTATSGTSSQSVTVIVYQAKFEIDADRGTNGHTDVGHSWWNLSIQPAAIQAYIPTNLTADQGIAGFYDHGHPIGAGVVTFGPQPDHGTGGTHVATGSHWWCISFDSYIVALRAVNNLAANPPEYIVYPGPNCTTEAEAIEGAAGCPVGYTGAKPWSLSAYLNTLPASTCGCAQ